MEMAQRNSPYPSEEDNVVPDRPYTGITQKKNKNNILIHNDLASSRAVSTPIRTIGQLMNDQMNFSPHPGSAKLYPVHDEFSIPQRPASSSLISERPEKRENGFANNRPMDAFIPSTEYPGNNSPSPVTPNNVPEPFQFGLQRKQTIKNVVLTEGNLVIEVPVPERVLSYGRMRVGQEFTHMRYTAATCDPDHFSKERFTLRPALMGRTIELFTVITMYNEDEDSFTKTITSVFKNIAHLCSRNISHSWGYNGWQKAVVCIVADGRNKIQEHVLTVLGVMGVYQEGIAKSHVNGKEVTAHIFEYTTQLVVDKNLSIRGSPEGIVPVQIIFCLKEKNAKKINSHRWFFNAFGPVLKPNICILLDVGTKPTSDSFYHLWRGGDYIS